MLLSQQKHYRTIVGRWLTFGRQLNTESLISRKPHRDIHPKYPAVTRFAPSPTGLLHLGSLRTALFNYLLAMNTGGKFYLRLEDTDRTRYHLDAEKNIFDTLKWCGINYANNPDGSTIKQSERAKQGLYWKYAKILLEKGLAYRCFCSKDRLNSLRLDGYDRKCARLDKDEVEKLMNVDNLSYTIRFKMPDIYEPVNDLLHGNVNIQTRKDRYGHDDPVLMKSDGFPTYHLANVVDDHLMGITHVIRGDEWLPSTPKHISMYKAFGWQPPQFTHIPLLTNLENDKKLSKRKGDASVLALKEKGVLPEALIPFVALLGWSPPRTISETTNEYYSIEELIKLFNLNHLTKGNVKVDTKKLWFFNKHFLQKRMTTPEEFEILYKKVFTCAKERFGAKNATPEKVRTVLRECGKALNSINEFNETFHYFFEKPNLETSASKDFLQKNDKRVINDILKSVQEKLSDSNFEDIIVGVCNDFNIKKRFAYECVRFALTGLLPGARIPILINVLGLNETRMRVQEAIDIK